jgi:hypothetical protein
MVHVVRRNLDRQANAVAVELLDLGVHRRVILPERLRPPRRRRR